MKKAILIFGLAALYLGIVSILVTNEPKGEENFTSEVFTIADYEENTREFRAVWVATVYQLNMPLHINEAQYKSAFESIINRVLSKNMNAIIFQVRPLNDAFFDSAYAPFSRYLAGSEGQDPGWDAMGWMVSYAQSRGVEFHAWLNPYRVANSADSKTSYLSTLAENNFAKMNPNLVVSGKISGSAYPYILNPGEPEVKTYIRNVVKEIIETYDVDGIHFDDYFYPYSGINDSEDQAAFDAYNPSSLSRADWRRQNVNDVVKGVMADITAHNDLNNVMVRFGISPFGIWQNGGEGSDTNGMQSYHSQYADSKKWVKEGWVHYINPQVYWEFSKSVAAYDKVVSWWVDTVRGTGVDLIIGHGIHNGNNWSAYEIENQIIYNNQFPEIKGSAFYSYAYLNTTNINNVVSHVWKNMPLSVWDYSPVSSPVVQLDGTLEGGVYKTDVTVSMTSDDDIYYKLGDGIWTLYETPFVLNNQGTHILYVKAVSLTLGDSLIEGYNIVINKVNLDVPTIEVTGNKIGNDYTLNSTVTLTANNMANLYYAVNHGSVGVYQKYTGPIVLNELGNYFFKTKTITSEGVESAEKTLLIKVVNECYPKPVVELTGAGTNGFYQNATLKLTGQTDMLYKVNDGAYEAYTKPIEFNTNGDYTVYYKNNDGCGTVYNETFTVDNIKPVDPVIELTGTPVDGFYLSKTEVSFTHDETEVDVYYRYYDAFNVMPSAWLLYQDPITFNKSTLFTVEYYAVDQALNQSETQELKFKMRIKPVEDNQFVVRNDEVVNYRGTSTPIELPTTYTEKEKEVRAVWVSTVSNIDIQRFVNIESYKAELVEILDIVEQNKFNTIFFQTRPMNDSFYPSDYAPFSRYITGTEGVDPGFDILAFVIEEAHKRNIEVHAWLNPYRVSTGTNSKLEQLGLLSDDNFAKQNPDLVIADKSGKLILNPGEAQVRAYVGNVVNELLSNYAVDGVHFDDYFYSYGGMFDQEDQATFDKYNPKGLSRDDWRRENVNLLVESINNIVKSYNQTKTDTVKFGISPFGIWKNGGEGSNTNGMSSYSAQYADTKKWVEEGWLDYIMPQLYWEFNHSVAPFADLVDWWANVTKDTGVDLIIGHGFYRFAENTWDNPNELIEQLRYISKYDNVKGSSFFTYKTLKSNDTEVLQTLQRLNDIYWTTQAGFPWATSIKPVEEIVCNDNETLIDGVCVLKPIECEDGTVIDGVCVLDDNKANSNRAIIISTVALSGAVLATAGVVIFNKFKIKK